MIGDQHYRIAEQYADNAWTEAPESLRADLLAAAQVHATLALASATAAASEQYRDVDCATCGHSGWCHGDQVDHPPPGVPCHVAQAADGRECPCTAFVYPEPQEDPEGAEEVVISRDTARVWDQQ